MPSATERAKIRKRRAELMAELRDLACTCGRASGRPHVVFRDADAEQDDPATRTLASVTFAKALPESTCPVKHAEGEAQTIVILKYGLHAGKPCECGTCWACTHGRANAQAEQGVQRLDRSLPTGKDSVETPQEARVASDVPAYPLDPPPRSQPAHAPPLSLPGRARDHVIEVQSAPLDLAPISVGRINPSMLPDCTACGHLASFHSEFRLGGTGCAVAGDLGGNGPCTCTSYNGPPPPAPRPRVHALQLPGCTCGQYFGTCICDSQQSNPKEH